MEIAENDKDKLEKDIRDLHPEDWKRVRSYVTKVRRLRKMDNNITNEMERSGINPINNTAYQSYNGTLYCAFCGKSEHEVFQLFGGRSWLLRALNNVFICDDCIELGSDKLSELKAESQGENIEPSEGI